MAEDHFFQRMHMLIKIIKQPDDPLCCRASAGGTSEAGYYLTFRGDVDQVLKCLKAVTEALEWAKAGKVPIETGNEYE